MYKMTFFASFHEIQDSSNVHLKKYTICRMIFFYQIHDLLKDIFHQIRDLSNNYLSIRRMTLF